MITYEFIAPGESLSIFRADYDGEGQITDSLSVPIDFRIPGPLARKVGTDRLQNIVEDYVKSMVRALNSKIS